MVVGIWKPQGQAFDYLAEEGEGLVLLGAVEEVREVQVLVRVNGFKEVGKEAQRGNEMRVFHAEKGRAHTESELFRTQQG